MKIRYVCHALQPDLSEGVKDDLDVIIDALDVGVLADSEELCQDFKVEGTKASSDQKGCLERIDNVGKDVKASGFLKLLALTPTWSQIKTLVQAAIDKQKKGAKGNTALHKLASLIEANTDLAQVSTRETTVNAQIDEESNFFMDELETLVDDDSIQECVGQFCRLVEGTAAKTRIMGAQLGDKFLQAAKLMQEEKPDKKDELMGALEVIDLAPSLCGGIAFQVIRKHGSYRQLYNRLTNTAKEAMKLLEEQPAYAKRLKATVDHMRDMKTFFDPANLSEDNITKFFQANADLDKLWPNLDTPVGRLCTAFKKTFPAGDLGQARYESLLVPVKEICQLFINEL